jgi:hypothetical protein
MHSLLTPKDYTQIQNEAEKYGQIPALRMAVKKLQRIAIQDILPQWGIHADYPLGIEEQADDSSLRD